jgi:hypothetical protein
MLSLVEINGIELRDQEEWCVHINNYKTKNDQA